MYHNCCMSISFLQLPSITHTHTPPFSKPLPTGWTGNRDFKVAPFLEHPNLRVEGESLLSLSSRPWLHDFRVRAGRETLLPACKTSEDSFKRDSEGKQRLKKRTEEKRREEESKGRRGERERRGEGRRGGEWEGRRGSSETLK